MDIDTDSDSGDGFAHPLLAWLAGVGEQLDAAVECPALSLPLDQYEGAMRQLAVYEARLASLRLSLTRQAELSEVQKLSGAATTAGWVQRVTRMGRCEASVSVRLAKALDQTIRATGRALAAGEISLGQAQVIDARSAASPTTSAPTSKRTRKRSSSTARRPLMSMTLTGPASICMR